MFASFPFPLLPRRSRYSDTRLSGFRVGDQARTTSPRSSLPNVFQAEKHANRAQFALRIQAKAEVWQQMTATTFDGERDPDSAR